MFDSSIIDLALTLAFIYFILALVASTVVEMLHNRQNLRGEKLYQAMKELYEDKKDEDKKDEDKKNEIKWTKFVDDYLITNPFITSLYPSPEWGIAKDSNGDKTKPKDSTDKTKANDSTSNETKANDLTGDETKGKVSTGKEIRAEDSTGKENAAKIVNMGRKPSYIPAKNFAQSMFHLLNSKIEGSPTDLVTIISKDKLSTKDIEFLLQKNKIIPDNVKKSLHTLLVQANGNVDKFLDNIGEYYDNSVNRVSGWFKRKTQRWLLIFGLVVTIVLNVDTIYISQTLWANKEALKKAADDIQNNLPKIKEISNNVNLPDSSKDGINNKEAIKKDSVKKDITKKEVSKKDTAKTEIVEKDTVKSPFDSLSLKQQLAVLRNQTNQLSEITSLPIGYSDGKNNIFTGDFYSERTWYNDIFKFLLKILGWIITALAIYLGAPFWFDLLNKIVNLRGTGKKPEDKDDKK